MASRTGRLIGAESNYFQHRENAGFQRAYARCFRCDRTERPFELTVPLNKVRQPRRREAGSWMCDFGLARAREVFLGQAGRRHLVILLFSPRMRADMSAALVDTEEN